MNTKQSDTQEGIDKRTIRAATESMSLDRHAGDVGDFDVYSESGSVYRVNVVTGDCGCPSVEYQEGKCKHLRRVEMEIGQRLVPDLGQETDVEMMIDARADQQAAETDQPEAITDGGVAVHSVENVNQQDQGRPEDCDCSPHFDATDLGCFPCFRAGYETANPNAAED